MLLMQSQLYNTDVIIIMRSIARKIGHAPAEKEKDSVALREVAAVM